MLWELLVKPPSYIKPGKAVKWLHCAPRETRCSPVRPGVVAGPKAHGRALSGCGAAPARPHMGQHPVEVSIALLYPPSFP